MSKAVHTTGLERIELERLRARVRRLFAILEETGEAITSEAPGAWMPPVDVSESKREVTIYLELPGVRADQVEIGLTGAELRVSGKKMKGAPKGTTTHLRTERSYGRFVRVIALRWPIHIKDASAELKNGLLTIRLPKLKERRGSEFKVKVVSGDNE